MAGPQTAIGDSIGLAIKMFEASEVKERVLILLTDGNDTASKMPPDRAAGIAADNNIVIHTIGIGDPGATGEEQVDFEALEKISAKTGGKSFRGDNREQLEGIYRALDEMTPQNYESYSYRPKIPLFHWPLGGSVGLVLFYHIAVMLWTALRRSKAQDTAETKPAAEVRP
jgi:Ca-activated chloride channel family protein